MAYVDQNASLILKFCGVFPSGLNRLHDTIEELNGSVPFRRAIAEQRVRLLSSKFTTEQNSYVVEVSVPYLARTGNYGVTTHGWEEGKVPLSAIVALFEAIGEFQPQ